ncbi:MAG: GNAT family N-acetyltransferase [Polyangiaceae bacterium]
MWQPASRAARMVAQVEFIDPRGDSGARMLRDRASFETFAREGLHQPTFDLEDELYRPYGFVLAAWTDAGKPAGFLSASRAADELHILSVAVEPSLRQLGLGRVLVERIVQHGRDTDMRLLFLEVRRSNTPAIRLYRRVGFVAVNVRARYYTDNDEDAVEMAFAIAPDALRPFGPPVDTGD